ncbi:hypothetical protein LTR04_005220 [Oleoguttula sp. CCFEE 6159]|nr:hypothetical protein LTR04_005220 [Oleoguttula sp. CCFEE 6159]
MAGMEQLEIHSKLEDEGDCKDGTDENSQSYLVRWINVAAGHSISWSIQPHKKSINFGIFKHPGTLNGVTPNLPSTATFEPPPTPGLLIEANTGGTKSRRGSTATSRNDTTTVVEKLKSLGLKPVAWTGKCEADKVSMGRYEVPEGEGGMYGLVFDNTFSKQVSKTATFVLMTHPTDAPPKSGHHLHYSQAFPGGSSTTVGTKASPGLPPISNSTDSLPALTPHRSLLAEPRPRSAHGTESKNVQGATLYTGILHKKRRKRGQPYARRFFSLDFTSSTLSYYQNRHSSALRGAVPLSLAAIGADERTREFSVDSGAEVWHLKAGNRKDFEGWRDAFERASSSAAAILSPAIPASNLSTWPTSPQCDPAEEREWARVEALVGRVVGTRDAVRRLAKDTDPKYLPPSLPGLGTAGSTGSNGAPSPSSEHGSSEYFKDDERVSERMPFWKRKTSNGASPAGNIFRRSVSAQLSVPAPSTALPVPPIPNATATLPRRTIHPIHPSDNDMHEHCMALLRDLDSVVADFSALLSESKQRRMPPLRTTTSRMSMDSTSSQEFFDAEDGEPNRSQILNIRHDSQDSGERDTVDDIVSEGDDSETSSDAGEAIGSFDRMPREGQSSIFPPKPESLTPLPLERVRRRTTVLPAKVPPPSIIGFLRKNAGKDLSTVSMPVSSNEPTSLLQRTAEQMEYSALLDSATTASAANGERLLYVAAFAISSFSNSRVKERAIRKPFNPMLGETYELVREDQGFRLVAEKISHHPVRTACQAEAKDWTFLQAPKPTQKFWGKSVELNTDGRAHVLLRSTGEHYSWSQATCYLRNVVAGEKYIEPVQTMTVINETTGEKAVATFKAGGMFSGRSEDVTVQAYDAKDSVLTLGLVGKWTSDLSLTSSGTDTGKKIWKVGGLVPNAASTYGFTNFAASLNEITPIEASKLPKTDSRLRPDQRAAEEGDLDRAEALKAKLEERQRARRKVMEDHGEQWKPRWFEKVAGKDGEDEVWRLRSGHEGYWEERASGRWTGVWDVFQH